MTNRVVPNDEILTLVAQEIQGRHPVSKRDIQFNDVVSALKECLKPIAVDKHDEYLWLIEQQHRELVIQWAQNSTAPRLSVYLSHRSGDLQRLRDSVLLHAKQERLFDVKSSDDLYPSVVRYVTTLKKVGRNTLERRFSIGRERATSLLDRMVSAGLISNRGKGDLWHIVHDNQPELPGKDGSEEVLAFVADEIFKRHTPARRNINQSSIAARLRIIFSEKNASHGEDSLAYILGIEKQHKDLCANSWGRNGREIPLLSIYLDPDLNLLPDIDYDKAVAAVMAEGSASTQLLCSNLNIPISRARKLLRDMQDRGVLGVRMDDGNAPRPILTQGDASFTSKGAEFRILKTCDLIVDRQSYQREYDKLRIKKIVAEGWLLGKCPPLVVNQRSDGKFYVIDGGHRHQGATECGIEFLPCYVHSGLTEEEEANLFVALSIGTKHLGAGPRLVAEIRGKNPAAIKLEDVVTSNGFKISKSKANNGICAAFALKKAQSMYGLTVLGDALGVLRAAWDGASDSLNAHFILGTSSFLARFNAGGKVKQGLIERLRKKVPKEVDRLARGVRATHSKSPNESIAITYMQLYNHGRPEGTRLDPNMLTERISTCYSCGKFKPQCECIKSEKSVD